MDEHRGHDTVSAAAERIEKQKQLEEPQRKSQQRIQEREKELQDLRQAVDSLTHSARATVEDSERIFTELIHSMKKRCSEVKKLIRDQEKAAVSQIESHLKQLEEEIAELRRRDAELAQLSHTEDHIHFLQSFQSVCTPPGPGDLPRVTVNPQVSFEAVRKQVSGLKEQLEDVCKGELVKISQTVKEVHILEPRTREDFLQLKEVHILEPRTREDFLQLEEVHILGPKTRADFLQYSCPLTLDPNTAHRYLCLSEGNRKVTHVGQIQSYRDHPERFDIWPQVLCREGLSGRCYWEAEWGGGVHIAVSYKEISRKGGGDDCALGRYNKSWSLFCSPYIYCFRHNNERTELPAPPSSRIGVYLDHRAGTLSFYNVSDTMTLLHRVQTIFTKPLYLGFRFYSGSVKLCDLG
ncbi:hypothetical protein AAFF_G00113930 [Aldrovandia affinis]|uniref:B30.2/SPRY domain-containing protein n=1 Tax=Aldrovandia affinis TaxID=143900 RepID=A0AAD7R134_9TELE|nr:hypothetical protein AAFF_G00113930 [Aldrovandia affinis]